MPDDNVAHDEGAGEDNADSAVTEAEVREALEAVRSAEAAGDTFDFEEKPTGADQAGTGADADKKAAISDAPWYEGITDEKALELAKRKPSLNDFAAEALGFRQKLSTAIVKPGKDAPEEDVASYRRAVGVPESPDGYEFKLPEGVSEKYAPGEDASEVTKGFQAAFHALNLSKDQAAGVLEHYYRTVAAVDEAQEAGFKAEAEKQVEALDKKWGADAPRNREAAVRAMMAFGGQELVDLAETSIIDGIPLGDHAAWVESFAKVGLQLQEAAPLLGASSEERESLQAEHTRLTGEIHAAHAAGDREKVRRLEAQREKISQSMVGNVPLVGSGGRVM